MMKSALLVGSSACSSTFASVATVISKVRMVLWLPSIALAMMLASVPALAQEVVTARQVLEAADLGNPVISPDGRQVAFRLEQASIEDDTYHTAWYVQDLDGASAPRRIADGGVPLREYVSGIVAPSKALWSADGKWVYYRAWLHERVSVWRAATDGSGAQEMTSDAADVRDFVLSDDAGTLTYSVGASRDQVVAAEQSEYERGIQIDGTVILAGGLHRSSRIEGRAATQRFLGSGWFSMGPLLSDHPDRWKAVDLASMTTRALSASEHPLPTLTAAALNPGLSATVSVEHPEDGRVALLTPAEAEEGQLGSRDVVLSVLPDKDTAQSTPCTDDLCRNRYITRIQWRPRSEEVVFTAHDYDRGRTQSIHAWNVATDTVRTIVVSDGLVSGSQRYWDIPCALSSEALVCVAAEAGRAPRLEAIDLDSGQRRVLFAPSAALDADIAAIAPATLLKWTDALGREFSGHLFEARKVDGDRPPPLFVNFYNCYGFLRGGMGDEWPLATLAGYGISSLCINAIPEYRTDPIARYDQGRAAVESVVELLASAGRIDRTRVGMGGLSYGSEVTMWTLMQSDVLAAASVASPVLSHSWYLFNSLREPFRAGAKDMWQLGTPEETPDRWREISPTYHLDRISAPILFQLPEQEFRLALDYAVPLIRRRQAEMYVFPEEAHIKFQPRHKLAVYERNLDWFRFWLQGHEDPDPAKRGQYLNWRAMRDALSGHAGGHPDGQGASESPSSTASAEDGDPPAGDGETR